MATRGPRRSYRHDEPKGEALAHRLTVTDLVKAYGVAEREIRESFHRVQGAVSLLNSAFANGEDQLPLCISERVNFADPDRALEKLQRDVWGMLVERLELRRAMSNRAWTELQRVIKEGEPVPITEETVIGELNKLLQRLPQMLEEAVEEVFDYLRPRGDRYKRNSQFEIPERVVLERVADPSWKSHWDVGHYAVQELTSLENVFLALDGKGQTSRSHHAAIVLAIRSAPKLAKSAPGLASTEYFECKLHYNRNLHIRFLRGDLLARFNQIAGGKRLRGARAKVGG